MNEKQEVWRWNSDPAWHSFCSMQQEAALAKLANNEFMRYHHIRSCTYFGVTAIEAFLNAQMRRHLEGKSVPHDKILKKLRWTKLDDKRAKWPSEICGKSVKFAPEVDSVFNVYRELRNEITHPKRRDDSIYVELDNANPDELAEAIAIAFVTVHEGTSEPFPYWVLGWNYVGMNRNPAFPHQGNNMNGFVYSLAGMGFNVQVSNLEWEKQFMTTLDGYRILKDGLDSYSDDIEPYWSHFPTRPRLTRRWWDHEFINRDVIEQERKGAPLDQF